MKNKCFYWLLSAVMLMATAVSCTDEGEKDDLLNPPPVSDSENSEEDDSNNSGEESSLSIPESENLQPTFPKQGGTAYVNFTAADDWTVTISETRNEGWITVNPTSGTAGDAQLTITIPFNETEEERKGVIALTCDTTHREITVTQTGVDIEREALIEFYKSTGGDHWINNTNWCSEKPVSEWYGVKTTEEGNVTGINMFDNNLSGTLPDVFDHLTNFQHIALSGNNLTGELPQSLYSRDITSVYMEHNQLEGSLSEKIGNWKNLTSLEISKNNFTGTPPAALGSLPKLTYCNLMLNRFSGELPPEIIAMEQRTENEKDFIFYLDPQQEGYEFSASTTRSMINLGDNLYLHPDGIAIEYRQGTNQAITYEQMKPILKKLYEKFDDAFDFVVCMYNVGNMAEIAGEIAGQAFPISNNVQGIDREIEDNSSDFGSSGKLKCLIQLSDRRQIRGSFLHELMHNWGALNFGQYCVDIDGIVNQEKVHWGISSIDGLLGGFKLETLERNVDGNPHKYRAFCSQLDWCFGVVNSSNYAYAPLELYLMGLLPPEEVPDIHYFTEVSGTSGENPSKNGIFYAEQEHILTIRDIINKFGARNPSYSIAQKEFRVLTLIITKNAVNDREWELIESDITKMQTKGSSGYTNGVKNFYEATGGRGTITFGGLDKLRK